MSLTRNLATVALVFSATMTPANATAQELPQTWQEQMNFRAGPTPFEPSDGLLVRPRRDE